MCQDARLTHHDSTVERLCTDRDDDVLSHTLENLGTRDEETVLLEDFAGLGIVPLLDTLLVGKLLDGVAFTSSTRFVASDIVTAEEDTVDGDNLSWLEQADITDDDILDVDDHFTTASDDLDGTVVSLLVELFELSFLLPIIDGTDQDDDSDSDTDGNTFDPFDLGLKATGSRAAVGLVDDVVIGAIDDLVDTESEGDDGSDSEQDLTSISIQVALLVENTHKNLILHRNPHEVEQALGLSNWQIVSTVDFPPLVHRSGPLRAGSVGGELVPVDGSWLGGFSFVGSDEKTFGSVESSLFRFHGSQECFVVARERSPSFSLLVSVGTSLAQVPTVPTDSPLPCRPSVWGS
jgi:hypothetical protein